MKPSPSESKGSGVIPREELEEELLDEELFDEELLVLLKVELEDERLEVEELLLERELLEELDNKLEVLDLLEDEEELLLAELLEPPPIHVVPTSIPVSPLNTYGLTAALHPPLQRS